MPKQTEEELKLIQLRLDNKKKRLEILTEKENSQVESRRITVEEKKAEIDEKRLYLDTIKALTDILSAQIIAEQKMPGSELTFERVVSDIEAFKIKEKIDYLMNKISK